MEIGCPACAARYDVPDDAIRPGRLMRCARCGETWAPVDAALPEPASLPALWHGDAESTAAPPLLAFEEGAPDEPSTEADMRLPLAPAAPRAGGPVLAAAWAASVIVLVAMGWGVWHAHAHIERAWPPSQRLFHMLEHKHRPHG